VGLYFGPDRTVVVNDFEAVCESMSSDDIADRPNLPTFFESREQEKARDDVPGVISLNGKHWQEQRRFALKT